MDETWGGRYRRARQIKRNLDLMSPEMVQNSTKAALPPPLPKELVTESKRGSRVEKWMEELEQAQSITKNRNSSYGSGGLSLGNLIEQYQNEFIRGIP